jgi:ferric-dicitrate binding protein FerR (iron transport regulator)
MYMDHELFDRLFEQHTAGVLNENDKGRLLSMLNDPAYEDALNRNLHALYQLNRDEEIAEPLMGAHIQAGVLQQLQPATITRRPSLRVTRMVRYTAAAALVAAIAIGAWLLYQSQMTDDRPQMTAGKKAIVPGSDKAILTLANGQQIVLDSAANGTLAQQPGSRIIKQNGQLVYKSDIEKSKIETSSLNTLATPRGGQYNLQLPDGTQVWLNAASSIQYPTAFTGKDRSVTVTGEAYFEVAQNAKQPFIVHSNNQQVQVLGTSFNINAYSDEPDTRTTLLDGSIRITNPTSKNPTSSHPTSAILSPGEQSILSSGVLTTAKANTQEVMAWRNGQIFLTSVSVPVVMRQISRWYNVDVVYEGKVPANRQFNGLIDRNVPLASLLEALESNNIHTKLEGSTLTVKP